MPFGSDLLDQRADGRAAGKADVVDALVPRQCVADLVPVTRHDVERASRKTDFGGQLCHANQRQAGVFGGLDHADVASGQRTADASPENLHRVVPRNDVARHAVRFAPGEDAVAVKVGQRFAVQLVAGAGVELEVPHQCQCVGPRLLDGFAAVTLFQQCQFIDVLCNLVGQLGQETSPFGGIDLVPDAFETIACRKHRRIDVGRIAALQFIECAAVGGVDDGESPAGGGGHAGIGDVIELHDGEMKDDGTASCTGSAARLQCNEQHFNMLERPRAAGWAPWRLQLFSRATECCFTWQEARPEVPPEETRCQRGTSRPGRLRPLPVHLQAGWPSSRHETGPPAARSAAPRC